MSGTFDVLGPKLFGQDILSIIARRQVKGYQLGTKGESRIDFARMGFASTVGLMVMKTVAVIGASSDRNKYGNKAVRAFRQQGYEVFPINPKEERIEGLPAFKSISDVPVRPQKISVYVPPSVLLKLLPEIAAKGCDELWLNPGAESNAVVQEAERLGLNVIQACSILATGVTPEEY